MDSQTIIKLTEAHIQPTYGRFPLCLAEGSGCRAKDPEGKSYLDFGSGIGVNSLGWADPQWAAAVAGQAATLQHTSNLYYTEPGARLAQAICKRTGMARVFFANSGAEANEGAIKAARKYSHDKYGEGRHTIISLVGSFHGRTMATLTATGQQHFHQHFFPFPGGFKYAPAGDMGALLPLLDGTVCAVMVEPIQGEGGVLPLDAAYLADLRELCSQNDILMITDEVQCGVGRTGSFLAGQQAGITPDIATLAKGLGGGLPIGAVVLGEKCTCALGKGDHGSTFGANPVSCAGALVVMERLDDAFLEKVAHKGAHLKQQLEALPGIAGVQGGGLMLGAALTPPLAAGEVIAKAMEKGLLLLSAKDRLRFLPPLTITLDELDEGVAILKTVLEESL